MLRVSFLVSILSLLLCGKAFSKQRDMGEATTHRSSTCLFKGSYVVGKDHDIKSSLSQISVRVAEPFMLEVLLLPSHLEAGTYISLTFYDPKDEKHAPISDLSRTGTDKEVEGSAFMQFKAFKKSGGQLAIAPVVYKKGYRGILEDKEQYYNPFLKDDAITSEDGRWLGGPGNLFTTLFVKIAGKGTYKATDLGEMLLPNDQGEYRFFVHLSRNIGKELFIIAAITKVAIIPSDRGLRSPITTTTLDISKKC